MSVPARTIPELLDAPLPPVQRLLGKLMTLGYKLAGKHRYDDFRVEHVRGTPFLVTPSVFNPKIPRTGALLSSMLDSNLVDRNATVLDMGTGSGICAVFAARHASRVVAVDINPAAVRCARVNALLNAADGKIDVRLGDLFTPVNDEQFDLVLFNPPFLRGAPKDDRDRAWRSTDVADRFAAGLRARLKPGGFALVVLSTFGDARHFLEEFSKQAFDISVLAERRYVNERLMVFRIAPQDVRY